MGRYPIETPTRVYRYTETESQSEKSKKTTDGKIFIDIKY